MKVKENGSNVLVEDAASCQHKRVSATVTIHRDFTVGKDEIMQPCGNFYDGMIESVVCLDCGSELSVGDFHFAE